MADTGERDVRNRLEQALFAFTSVGMWAAAPEEVREEYRLDADAFLSALPTVGLRIGRVEE